MRKKIEKLAVCAAVLCLSASPVLAQGRGNGGGNGNGNGNAAAGANMRVGPGGMGAGAGASGHFGGQSDQNISGQGRANGNGPNAVDRTFGADRAAVRPNADTSAHGNAASELGRLNAVNASANARANASPNSAVGAIATYETDMKSALAITNTTRRNAAITAARQKLAQTSNKRLTPSAVTRIDSELNIRGAAPNLGVP